MGSVLLSPMLFGENLSDKDPTYFQPKEEIVQSAMTYDGTVDTVKGGIAKGIDVLTKPFQWAGDAVSWSGKKIAQVIKTPQTQAVSKFVEETSAVVGSVPDIAVKMTQNATDFVVDSVMKPHEIHKGAARLIGGSYQQFGRLTASIDPINDLLQSTAKAGGDMVAGAVRAVNANAGDNVQKTVNQIDGALSVLNRQSRVIRRQKGLLGQGEYLKIIGNAENTTGLKEKIKAYYLTKQSDNPDLQYAKQQEDILKKVENVDLENVSEKIQQEEKKTGGLLETLRRQEQKSRLDKEVQSSKENQQALNYAILQQKANKH